MMTQDKLIEWLVLNLECTNCPVYAECAEAKPRTCSSFLNAMLRASDAVVMKAVEVTAWKIRRTKRDLIKERDPERRKKLQNHLAKLRYDLREVRKYIGRRDRTECNT
jgi:hypothetical protein